MTKSFHANFGDYAWRGGRGATKHTYTVMDIAKITGYTRSTIWTYTKLGKLNPANLASVVEFCMRTAERKRSQTEKREKKIVRNKILKELNSYPNIPTLIMKDVINISKPKI